MDNKTSLLTNKLTNNMFVKATTYNIDPGYMYWDMFGHFPSYKYVVDINRIDEEEDFDIYNVIYNDLIASGDFETVLYEFNKCVKRDDTHYEKWQRRQKETYVNRFYVVKKDEPVMVYYEYDTLFVISHLGSDVLDATAAKYLEKYDQHDGEAKCHIVVDDDSLYLESFNVSLDRDIDFDMYNEGFEDVHKSIVKSVNEDKNGLYLLYGIAGTGKTTYIRHLIKECSTEKRKFIFVPIKVFERFTDPDILPFLLNNRGCIYIIEDCEKLVTVDDDGIRSDGISDLLNMTDGLLSDALDIKIICTFNTDYEKIDDALLRPGRCRCDYEFKKLARDRANRVAEKLGLKEVKSDVTLAALFHPDADRKEEKKRKIGFN